VHGKVVLHRYTQQSRPHPIFTVGGKLSPIVMGMVGVEREVLDRVLLVDLRKRLQTIAHQGPMLRHIYSGHNILAAHQVRIILLKALPDGSHPTANVSAAATTGIITNTAVVELVGSPVFGSRSLTSPMTKMASTSAVQSAAPARDAEPITDE
jgi:hypothetical protein